MAKKSCASAIDRHAATVPAQTIYAELRAAIRETDAISFKLLGLVPLWLMLPPALQAGGTAPSLQWGWYPIPALAILVATAWSVFADVGVRARDGRAPAAST